MKLSFLSSIISFVKNLPAIKNFAKPIQTQASSSNKSPLRPALHAQARAAFSCEVMKENKKSISIEPAYDMRAPVGRLIAEARGETYVEPVAATTSVVEIVQKPIVRLAVVSEPDMEIAPIAEKAEETLEEIAVLEPTPIDVEIVETTIIEMPAEPKKKTIRKRTAIKKTSRASAKTSKKTVKSSSYGTGAKKTKKTATRTRRKVEIPPEARGFGF